jgi:DNA-binding response OmpR family regulator
MRASSGCGRRCSNWGARLIAERPQKRVLVGEDNAGHRDVMALVLSSAGYYVSGQDHSAHALDSMRAQQPDLLILDLMMPEVDGIQVLTQVQTLGYRLPVLIVTASPVKSVPGADALLHKPFEIDALVHAVEALIGPAQDA